MAPESKRKVANETLPAVSGVLRFKEAAQNGHMSSLHACSVTCPASLNHVKNRFGKATTAQTNFSRLTCPTDESKKRTSIKPAILHGITLGLAAPIKFCQNVHPSQESVNVNLKGAKSSEKKQSTSSVHIGILRYCKQIMGRNFNKGALYTHGKFIQAEWDDCFAFTKTNSVKVDNFSSHNHKHPTIPKEKDLLFREHALNLIRRSSINRNHNPSEFFGSNSDLSKLSMVS